MVTAIARANQLVVLLIAESPPSHDCTALVDSSDVDAGQLGKSSKLACNTSHGVSQEGGSVLFCIFFLQVRRGEKVTQR